MFYQEKHPGEKPPHLVETNKHDLLVINPLFRRQGKVPDGFSDHLSTWVSLSCNEGAVAPEKHRAVSATVAGNTDTKEQGS